jgi:hypothetical protein
LCLTDPKPFRSCLVFLMVLSFIVLSSSAATDNSNAPLKKVLNSKGYFLGSPATNWPYAGGFIVTLGKSANFVDLPSTIQKPETQSGIVDFMAEKKTSGFSLSAVLTGMQALIGGNPGGGIGHQSNLTFQELKAQGSKINLGQANDILKNSDVKAQIDKWLHTPNQQVFIIGETLSTTEISVSSSSTWNGDLSFNGSPVSKCNDTTSSKDSASKTTSTSSNGAGGASSAPSDSTSKAASGAPKNSSPASKSSKSSATPTTPGGELHLCTNGSNTITMKTDTPLVFAVGAYKVIRSKGAAAGDFELQPVFVTTGGGTLAEDSDARKNLAHSAKLAEAVSTTWGREAWPTAH